MKKDNKYFYEMKTGFLNTISIIILLVMVLTTFLIFKLTNMNFEISELDYFIVMIALFPYFFIHEILHSIGYVVNGAKFKNITYGIHLEKGVLCCSCKQEITKKNVLWSLIYPFIFIGIITYIIGLIFNIQSLIILSIANIMGCSGDLIMFYDFIKLKDFRFFEYDNPIAFGITTKDDLKDVKLLGLKRVEEDNIIQTIDKKISISKFSIIFMIGYFVLCLINYFL